MAFLRENLEIMELEEVPDIDTLQKSFNRLIKVYHPDLNINRQQWAHENTQKLIQAFQTLRNSIQSGKLKPFTPVRETVESRSGSRMNIYSNNPRAYRKTNSTPATATYAAENERRFRFQLLSGENGGYALPLENIVRIIAFNDPRVKRGLLGYYCKFEEDIYPITSLTGQKLHIQPSDYIILFKLHDLPGIGVHIPGNYKFIEVKSIHQSEFVKHNPKELDSNGWIMHENFPYLYPGSHILSAIKKFATKA